MKAIVEVLKTAVFEANAAWEALQHLLHGVLLQS